MKIKLPQSIGITSIRLSLGLVYIWFGFLKLCGKCDLHELIYQTLPWMPKLIVMPTLGLGEVIIGLMLLYPFNMPLTLILFFGHMVGTFLPVILLPEMTSHGTLLLPTPTGQYIFKNLVFLACGVLLAEQYFRNINKRKPIKQQALAQPSDSTLL